MASLNQAKIIKGLTSLLAKKQVPGKNFIFDFLSIYGATRKATIDLIRKGDKSRNVAQIAGDIAIPKKIYFRKVDSSKELHKAFKEIRALPVIETQKIRYVIVVSDKELLGYDRKVDDTITIDIKDLLSEYEFFLPLTGEYEKATLTASHPIDLKACDKMGKLLTALEHCNKNSQSDDFKHRVNTFLMRLLFCYYAEDSGIFPIKGQMNNALQSLTKLDGSDVGSFFEKLFAVLNLPNKSPKRKGFSQTLKAFPYVGGDIFSDQIEMIQFDAKARRLLVDCGNQDWTNISPVIFGGMFQAVIDPKVRRSLGAHYTSEENIHKVIDTLFLDDLKEEFETAVSLKNRPSKKRRLLALWDKISQLNFLDPACGCGNFLVVTYKELRDLELQILSELDKNHFINVSESALLDVKTLSRVSIDQFYGIEIEEFSADVARVSLLLMEHITNKKFAERFGQVFPSIPLRHNPNILCGNALRVDWSKVAHKKTIDYIISNPPFSGAHKMTSNQKEDMALVFKEQKCGTLDYVVAWYRLAAEYMHQHTHSETALVSTNSICQGEQVGALWDPLLQEGFSIIFAHQTFKWSNEAKGNAAVYCVVIGFSKQRRNASYLFRYETLKSNPTRSTVSNINPYLTEGENIIVQKSGKPLSGKREICFGNMPLDGGALIIEASEYQNFLKKEPEAKKMIKKFVGAEELLHRLPRYCLWLKNYSTEEINELPLVKERVEACKKFRLSSKRSATVNKASQPHLFESGINPSTAVIVPRVSSERRDYIPMMFIANDVIASDSTFILPDATLYDFGILESRMHMTWMRTVCGRLEMRYRYSKDLCYNTFYWPEVTDTQKENIETLAQNILDVRDQYFDKTLADLYDPDLMPEELRKAHEALDLAVDRLYRKRAFESDEQRLKLLLKRYQQMTNPDLDGLIDFDDVE